VAVFGSFWSWACPLLVKPVCSVMSWTRLSQAAPHATQHRASILASTPGSVFLMVLKGGVFWLV
jgi:hypothetical protein